jgi:hypothetical protein
MVEGQIDLEDAPAERLACEEAVQLSDYLYSRTADVIAWCHPRFPYN